MTNKMTDQTIEQLNENFSLQQIGHLLCFKKGEAGIPLIEIQNEQADARISLQGAHLLDWRQKSGDRIIWLSDKAVFGKGKSIRGGIPVCWPWFGAHDTQPAYPAHGFARTSLWRVTKTAPLSSAETQITFSLESSQLDETIQAMWPPPTTLEYVVTIGKQLTLALTTCNESNEPIRISQALHTYFDVGDIRQTSVYGLEGRDYLDKPDGFKRKTQAGPISIKGEVDRIYLQTADDVVVDNKKIKIIIKKQGSHSTVVWNPGKAVADKMGDLGADGYMSMLCVESANAAEDAVTIEPGGRHTLQVQYVLEND